MSNTDPDRPSDAERVIMALATRQHGVVSRVQLVRTGVNFNLVNHRVRTGRMRALHRGVYLVGPLMAPYTREMAAVLACGEGAALSYHSAARLWQLLPRGREDDAVDVTVTRGRTGRRPHIRVRHIRSLMPDEVTAHEGIPVTTPARTLCDLASTSGSRELERALAEALALRLVHSREILALLDRHRRLRGTSRLRAFLDGDLSAARTRSEAEERFLALTRKARLKDPAVNVKIAGCTVDFLWRAERLVVEVDGRAFHSARRRFEGDRARDATLVAAGLRVMRVTWHQIVNEPEVVLVRLAQALARSPQL